MNASTLKLKVNKLPKWACKLIESLEREVSELEKQRDTLTRERTAISPEEAGIGWEVLSHGANRDVYPIPARAEVTFSTEHGIIHCSLREDALQVRAENDTLVVVSSGGVNVLSIETR